MLIIHNLIFSFLYLCPMKTFIFLLIFFCNSFAFSQNLIPNSGFDDVNTCFENQSGCSPKAWKYSCNIIPKYYYNKKLNIYDIAILMFYKLEPQIRDYLEVPILCPLVK